MFFGLWGLSGNSLWRKKMKKVCFSNFTTVHMANFYTCNLHCHFWILQNPQCFLNSGGYQETVCEEFFWKNAFFKFHLRPYGEFLYLRPALPFRNITKNPRWFFGLWGHQETGCEEKRQPMHVLLFTMVNFYTCDLHCQFFKFFLHSLFTGDPQSP